MLPSVQDRCEHGREIGHALVVLQLQPPSPNRLYCKDINRPEENPDINKFTFLGYTFRPRKTMSVSPANSYIVLALDDLRHIDTLKVNDRPSEMPISYKWKSDPKSRLGT
ncbi:MAG TPA: hypothetical protein VKG79_12900 [Bryobacteraceae bacterium]|nr:hypothetical protein [Bryobacteraceae bacterium]